MEIIGYVKSDFPTKFGIPRQSGIAKELISKIVFEPKYRVREAFRGLEEFSHIWILWKFSECEGKEWSPTVRPPKLGGNKRVGVFATRSPFRPNNIALSSVKLEGIEFTEKDGPVLIVSGADIMDNTPIYDIKPYIAYTDCHTKSSSGFALLPGENTLSVEFEKGLLEKIPPDKRSALISILEQDPRPGYIDDERRCGFSFAGYEISFFVKEGTLIVENVE